MADINFTAYSFLASSATGASARTMPNRLNDVFNVKDFGAVGDGTTDDTTAIQTTIDTAFGGPTGRVAALSYLNKAVFFPPGIYKTTNTITIPCVFGATIMGSGSHATVINNTHASNSAVVTNGFAYSRMIGFKIKTVAAHCLHLNCSVSAILKDQSSSFVNMAYEGGAWGVGVGPTMGSEMLFVNNTFTNHYFGMDTHNYNCLQWTLLGGRFITCQYGIYCGGSAPVIVGVQFDSSVVADLYTDSGANDAFFVLGCHSNSTLAWNPTSANAFTIAGCSHNTSSNSGFIKTSGVPMTIKGCISNLGTLEVTNNPNVKVLCSRFNRSAWLTANIANFYGNVEEENLLVGTATVVKRIRDTVDGVPNRVTLTYQAV